VLDDDDSRILRVVLVPNTIVECVQKAAFVVLADFSIYQFVRRQKSKLYIPDSIGQRRGIEKEWQPEVLKSLLFA